MRWVWVPPKKKPAGMYADGVSIAGSKTPLIAAFERPDQGVYAKAYLSYPGLDKVTPYDGKLPALYPSAGVAA